MLVLQVVPGEEGRVQPTVFTLAFRSRPGRSASSIRSTASASSLDELQRAEWAKVWERVRGSCSRLVDAARNAHREGRGAVVLVTHSPVISAIVAQVSLAERASRPPVPSAHPLFFPPFSLSFCRRSE